MTVVLGAQHLLTEGMRSALGTTPQGPVPLVVAVTNPSDSLDQRKRVLTEARAHHPTAYLLAIVPVSDIASAFDVGANEAVLHDAPAEEVSARLGRVSWHAPLHPDGILESVRTFASPAAFFDQTGLHRAVSVAYRGLFLREEAQLLGRPLSEIVPTGPDALPHPGPTGQAAVHSFVVELPTELGGRRLRFVCVPIGGGCLALVHSEVVGAHAGRGYAAAKACRLITLGAVSMSLAHDFNNLLTVILGNAAFLKDEVARATTGERLLRDLEHSATRAGDLTEQILRYASGTDETPLRVDLNLLVRELDPFLHSIVVPAATLRLELAESLGAVDAEVSGLTQVLINLVQNAVEATTDARGPVVVRTGADDVSEALAGQLEPRHALAGQSAVFLEVEDQGVGMVPAIVAQAFTPFFSTRGHGRGLGLSVVREVARSHGGGIQVETAPGRGTRVRVWLPASVPNAPVDKATSTERWSSRGRVLVADDEPEVRGLLRRVLVGAGFQVYEAEDGDAALELVDAHPDARLLILDFTMPRLDGAEVARQMITQGSPVPILMMSGYAVSQVKARLANLEVAGFLKKPFLPGAVMAKVKRILGE